MRLPEDFEEHNNGKPLVYMFAGVCTFIVLLFVVVMMMNSQPIRKNKENINKDQQITLDSNENDKTEEKSDLVAEDLDFWDMYPSDADKDEDADGEYEKPASKEEKEEDREEEKTISP